MKNIGFSLFSVLGALVLFLSFGGAKDSTAQTTNSDYQDFNIEDAVTLNQVPMSTANVNFKFKLVAFDDKTQGPVTADTKAVDFALMVTNDSRYIFNLVTFTLGSLTLESAQSGQSIISIPPNPCLPNPVICGFPYRYVGSLTNVAPFSTNYVLFNHVGVLGGTVPIAVNLPGSISLDQKTIANFQGTLLIYQTQASTLPSDRLPMNVTEVISPNNDNLIPLIVNNQTTASDTLTNIQNRLISMETTITNIWKRLSQSIKTLI